MANEKRQERLPLWFIHGAGGTKSKWRRIQERLTDIPAAYVDLPGHGSDAMDGVYSGGEYSIEGYAQWLSDQLTEEIMIVGHSMGGLIGLEVASINPLVRGVVLVSSHYCLPVHSKILSELADGRFPDSLFYASYAKGADPQLLEQEKSELSLVSTDTTFRDYDACDRYSNGRSVASNLDIPMYAIYGAADRLLPPDAKSDLMRANTGLHQMSVDGAGHYVMLENPDVVARELRQIVQNI